MRRVLYQANFCAECGNRLERRRWWQSGCFCQHCARGLRPFRLTLPLCLLGGGLILGFALSTSRQEKAVMTVPLPAVSAQDATATLRPAPLRSAADQAQTYFCGARTKKGTACRQRVREDGLRCRWHEGQPALKRNPTPD